MSAAEDERDEASDTRTPLGIDQYRTRHTYGTTRGVLKGVRVRGSNLPPVDTGQIYNM